MRFKLAEIAHALTLPAPAVDAEISAVSIDSRTVTPGALFVALPGARVDGHACVAAAAAAGAAATLVMRPVEVPIPQLVVPDTRRALGTLAAAARRRYSGAVLALTGSNGKTTVKEMLAAILAQRGLVWATRGNLNNDIGLPLTLLELESGYRHAVLELGANHPGEIAYLTAIARPDVALITNAGPAHLEGFGTLKGVAQAKGEIYQGLSPQGCAVINADDAYAGLWRALVGTRRCVEFGLQGAAAVHAEALVLDADGARFRLVMPGGAAAVRIAAPGRHNVMNALAAAAGAYALGLDAPTIAAGLAAFAGVAGRLIVHRVAAGVVVIDDSYNANPASLKAGIAVLMAQPGSKLLVLGDMAELGDEGVERHRQAGVEARAMGVERLYTVGDLARHAAQAFGDPARHYPDHAALTAAVHAALVAPVAVLVKGSRFMRMEQVVRGLLAVPSAVPRGAVRARA